MGVAERDLVFGEAVRVGIRRVTTIIVSAFVLGRGRGRGRPVDHLVDHVISRITLGVFPTLRSILLDPLLRPPFLLAAALPFLGIRIRRGKIIKIGHLEHVVLGVVRDLAVAFIDHVFAHGVERAELASFPVAVYADVAHCEFLAEVGYEALGVDEVFGVGNEEGVLARHVREVVFE